MRFAFIALIFLLLVHVSSGQNRSFMLGLSTGTNVNPTWADSEETLAPGWYAGAVGTVILKPRLWLTSSLGMIYDRVAWDHQWPYEYFYEEDWEAYWLESSTIFSEQLIQRDQWHLRAGVGLSVKAYCGARVATKLIDPAGEVVYSSEAGVPHAYYNWAYDIPIQLAFDYHLQRGQSFIFVTEYYHQLRDKLENPHMRQAMYVHVWRPYSGPGLMTLKVAWLFAMN